MPLSGTETVIQIESVSKRFGDFEALKGVSLDVASGERVVVCGPSGSGKSTLVRCLSRLIDATAGQVDFDGQDLLATSDKEMVTNVFAFADLVLSLIHI